MERVIDSPQRGLSMSMASDLSTFLKYPHFEDESENYLTALKEACEVRVQRFAEKPYPNNGLGLTALLEQLKSMHEVPEAEELLQRTLEILETSHFGVREDTIK